MVGGATVEPDCCRKLGVDLISLTNKVNERNDHRVMNEAPQQ